LISLISHDALIAEAGNPIAQVILRSLARKNLDAVLLASFPVSISRFSRYCRKQILVPSMGIEKEYAKAVEKIVKRIKFNVFFPVFEWSLMPVSKNREKIGQYVKLPIASHESILICFDKASTMKTAANNGIPIPKTYFVRNRSELQKVLKEIAYPAVVKPRWSMVWKEDHAFHRRCGYVNSAAELMATYRSIHQYFPFPFVQEYVPGVNYSVAAVYNEGKPRAFCCIKVQRAWPASGGNSCFRESAPLDPNMKRHAEALLERLNWHGIAEVEFRLDSRDGVPRLMEINPRFWGSLEVAVRSGVDFPYLLYRIAMDGDVNGVSSYKVGVKGRYMAQDILYMVSLFTDASLNPAIRSPNRFRTLLRWLRFYEPEVFYDLLYLDDPLPFLFALGLSPRDVAGFLRQEKYAWSPPGVRS
jgi:predicted ATP-grasp superfamily ATP-dependent carboligase